MDLEADATELCDPYSECCDGRRPVRGASEMHPLRQLRGFHVGSMRIPTLWWLSCPGDPELQHCYAIATFSTNFLAVFKGLSTPRPRECEAASSISAEVRLGA